MKAEDYLELSTCTTVSVPEVLDKKAKETYEKPEREMLLEVDENIIDAGSAVVLTNKLLQLCNGAVCDENREFIEIHDCKLEDFMELIEGLNGQPVLVFLTFSMI